ncbi:MAG: hypothetical protein EPO36_02260 [Chloroflexota bacterium]|nr:MAG: hypothetical protein EPO36_02260 [Chloroflexota bacterium]
MSAGRRRLHDARLEALRTAAQLAGALGGSLTVRPGRLDELAALLRAVDAQPLQSVGPSGNSALPGAPGNASDRQPGAEG